MIKTDKEERDMVESFLTKNFMQDVERTIIKMK